MTKADRINLALKTSFKDSQISVIDDSESHRGHAGFSEGGESHFQIKIVVCNSVGSFEINIIIDFCSVG